MGSDVPDRLIEIQTPEINVDAIMEQIRQRVGERRAALGYDQRQFPTFGLADSPEEPKDIPHDPNLYHYLRLANESYAQLDTEPLLAPSPATRVPLLGALWQRVRGQVHGLVLFYVNRTVTQQVTVNRYLVSVINRLTAQVEAQQRELLALQREVETLRATLPPSQEL